MNRLFRSLFFPLAVQLLTLAAFVLLILGGLAADTDDMAFAKELRNTNLANLIVWSYWWPLIVLSAIFLGRVWCMVCPMELVASLAARIGLKRSPPALLRSGWAITLFYVLILFVGIHTLAIHRVPFRMGLYMLILLAATVVAGLLFARNAFCAYVCPVGHLLGLYARLAPLGWGVRDNALCRDCKDHSCIAARNAYWFQGRSCGVGLTPANVDDNTACLLCGQCLKACDRNNPGVEGRPNPGWFARPWFKDLLALKPLSAAQAAFCLVVSGFVIYEVFTEWGATKGLLLWTPNRIGAALDAEGVWSLGLIKSLTLFVALPMLIWALPYSLFRLLGGKLELGRYICSFGIAFIPTMAAAHAIKVLLKMTSRIPYWERVFSDPVGAETARGILDKTIVLAPLPGWREPAMTALSLVLIAGGVTLSAAIVRKLVAAYAPEAGWHAGTLYLIPGLYGGAFAVMLVVWRLF